MKWQPRQSCGVELFPYVNAFFCSISIALFVSPTLIEWNGYETRQTPLLYVFVDLKVHNVQKISYHFDCVDQ